MIREGLIVLFKFPHTDQSQGKLRPALVLRKLPSLYDDWLICMISTKLSQCILEIDVTMKKEDPDFEKSGLKSASVIRVNRLAVVESKIFLGVIGSLPVERMICVKKRLIDWLNGT